MERQAKLRRLNEFRRSKPFCSASAMSQILIDVKKHGLPDLTGRRAMREARNLITSTSDEYGSILQTMQCEAVNGDMISIPVANPFAQLTQCLKESDSFRSFVKSRLDLHPSSPEHPWTLILYTDEVTPGNPLAHMNHRKLQTCYWSFLEFGINALCHEETWFVAMIEFSSVINQLSGTLSQAFGAVLLTFFQPDGFDMMRGGINLKFDDCDVRLFAAARMVLQDGGAHKTVWQARGDGASKFCMLCKNLFTQQSKVVEEDGARLLRCDVIKLDELVASTSSELRTNARYLHRMSTTMSHDDFTRLQQALGLTYAKRGFLLDPRLDNVLDPTEALCHDPMHCLFNDGVANLTIYLCFEEFIRAGKVGVYESFSEYLGHWTFPGRLHSDHLSDIFMDERRDKHRSACHIKCQASDLYSLLNVLAIYVQNVLRPLDLANSACHALLSLVDVVDLVMATLRVPIAPATLLAAIHKFLEVFTGAFGHEWLIPKFHWLLHMPETLQRYGKLLNCFALERKHKVAKRHAGETTARSKRTSTYLLSEVICDHFASLEAHGFNYDPSLVRGYAAPKKTRSLLLKALELDDTGGPINIAQVARCTALATCQQRDVVLLKDGSGFRAGRVELHADVEGTLVSLVQTFEHIRRVPDTALAIWKPIVGPSECWSTCDILSAVEFCIYPDGTMGTMLPIEFR